MCRRTALIGIAAAAFGAGFILSCVLEGLLIRIIIGAVLIFAGVLVLNQR